MKKTRVILIIIVGLTLIIIGIFTSMSLIQRVRTNQTAAETEDQTVRTNVVVVTRDLFLGDTITAADVTLSNVPVEIAPRTAITNLEEPVGKIIKTDLVQGEMLLSKIIKTDLVQGEMLLSHNLANPTNNNKDLSFILSEDHVLLAFPATDLMSRESMVQRGDIIDIFATFEEEVKTVGDVNAATGEPQEPQTRTFTIDTMQKVSVTALVLEIVEEDNASNSSPIPGADDQASSRSATRISAYLLALNPQDALVLKHLKDTDAVFDIVLRAPTSVMQFDLTPVTEEYIIEFYGLEILP